LENKKKKQAADVKEAVDEAFFKEIHHGLIEVCAFFFFPMCRL
jgi:hypothetical protein